MTSETRISAARASEVRARSKKLVDCKQVGEALDSLAQQLHDLVSNKDPLFVGVMHGGLIPIAQLITRLDFPLELDYIHATRYGNATSGSHELHWRVRPAHSLTNRNIVVVDDIYDEGYTLAAVMQKIKELQPKSLMSVVLFNKLHDHKAEFTPDLVGMDIPDHYIFGNGMDYKGYFRNLTDIYALHPEDMNR